MAIVMGRKHRRALSRQRGDYVYTPRHVEVELIYVDPPQDLSKKP